MKIETSLNLHDKVVTIIDGNILMFKVVKIRFMLEKQNEKEGGYIEYDLWRTDQAFSFDAPYKCRKLTFKETDLGRSFWRNREELLEHFSKAEIKISYTDELEKRRQQ